MGEIRENGKNNNMPGVPVTSPFAIRAGFRRDACWGCVGAFRRIYTNEGEEARSWLRSLGIGDDDISKYGLGFVGRAEEAASGFPVEGRTLRGYVTIPLPTNGFADVPTCALVPVGGDPRSAIMPSGVAVPVWNADALGTGVPSVCVAMSPLEAMALSKAAGMPAVALVVRGNAYRLAAAIGRVPEGERPGRVKLALGYDGRGLALAAETARYLGLVGVPCSVAAMLPNGAADAFAWLEDLRGVGWEFEESEPRTKENISSLHTTRWLAHE